MMINKKVFYAVVILLSFTILISVKNFNYSPNEMPFEAASTLGNLTKYNLVINCSFPEKIDSVPLLKIEPIEITSEKAMEIGTYLFEMGDIDTIKKIPWKGILLQNEKNDLEFFGLNRIYYYTKEAPSIEKWAENDTVRLAEEFLKRISFYWIFDTEIDLELERVGPCWITTETNAMIKNETTTVHAIGVYYTLKIHDIELVGPGADFNVWIANGQIVTAELHKPSISIIGSQEIVKTPEEAINRLIKGYSDTYVAGYEVAYGPIPNKGTCTIENVKLVYFIDFSKEHQTNVPVFYQIQGRLTFYDKNLGETIIKQFTDLQLATK